TLSQIPTLLHPSGVVSRALLTLTNKIYVTATATDGDGDTAHATSPSGLALNFYDDGPSITASGTTASLSVDETPGVQVGDHDIRSEERRGGKEGSTGLVEA